MFRLQINDIIIDGLQIIAFRVRIVWTLHLDRVHHDYRFTKETSRRTCTDSIVVTVVVLVVVVVQELRVYPTSGTDI